MDVNRLEDAASCGSVIKSCSCYFDRKWCTYEIVKMNMKNCKLKFGQILLERIGIDVIGDMIHKTIFPIEFLVATFNVSSLIVFQVVMFLQFFE